MKITQRLSEAWTFFGIIVCVLLAGSAAADQKENADALHRLIIDKVDNIVAGSGEIKGQRTDYSGKKSPKALVVCMDWRAVTPPKSVEAAASEAMTSCKAACKATCVLADRDGQNALQPPADWFAAQSSPAPSGLDVAMRQSLFMRGIQPGGAVPSHRSGFPVELVLRLVSIDGKPRGDRQQFFTIGLARNGNPYGAGFGGCHGWVANVASLEPGEVKFEDVSLAQVQTEGPCNADELETESRFVAALKQVSRWRIEGDGLVVESGGGTMRLEDVSMPGGSWGNWFSQAASVQKKFEKWGMLGTWAWDCSKPPSKQNNYFLHRVVDADHVQRDMMEGETDRGFVVIIDKAAQKGPNEMSVSGTRDGKPFTSTFRVEPNRMMVTESTVDGKVVVAQGRAVPGGGQLPWINKCSQ